MLDPRGRLLYVALGFVTLRSAPRLPALDLLHRGGAFVDEGTAWEPTPWRAVQRAAWEALRQAAQS